MATDSSVKRAYERLTPAQLEELRQIDSPTISNAIEAFKVRDRTEGFMGMDVRCLYPEKGVMVGYAVTAKADTMTPGASRGRAGWFALWEALAAAPKPAVLVLKDVSPRRNHSAHFGEVMGTIARRLGAVGVVTDGGVRDFHEVSALGLHYFAAGLVCSHGNAAIFDVGVPVEVSGLYIQPGDLLHGDVNGLVLVPDAICDRVAQEVNNVRTREGERMDYINSPEFTVEGLKKMMGLTK